MPVRALLEQRTGRPVARGALYTALERLEAKGCLRSAMGDPTAERGGKARRYFTVTPPGVRALKACTRPWPACRAASRPFWSSHDVAAHLRLPPPAERLLRAQPCATPNGATPSSAICVRSSPSLAAPRRRRRTALVLAPVRAAGRAFRGQPRRAGAAPPRRRRVDRWPPSRPRVLGAGWPREVRHAWRAMWQRPALSAVIVGTLALALTANAVIFNLADALYLRPFRFADVDRLILVASDTSVDKPYFDRESVAAGGFPRLDAPVTTVPRCGGRMVGSELFRARAARAGARVPREPRLLRLDAGAAAAGPRLHRGREPPGGDAPWSCPTRSGRGDSTPIRGSLGPPCGSTARRTR